MQALQVYITVNYKKYIGGSLFILLISLLTGCLTDTRDRSWSMYKADAASSSYSSHTQINKENISQLKLTWTFYPGDNMPDDRPGRSQCNPIIIDGIMYASSARHRIYAIDASSGKMI